ncbi:MAG: hypothetical protein A3F11_11250 [Gammaproteobacteria bacterium RIFCSPHIGHO2_12_FULL_37_14]|nr:MAG: hypothetical protein A3F11_11250 [Gammaproteobacteria bacterium RIFCSPHIGHO2_12_FULL_37_14]
MKKLFNILLSSSILVTVVGCATITPTQPGTGKVTITKGPISSSCKWRGKVSVTDEARSMDTPYQHTSLKSNEFNRLRNQAMQLGANTVLLLPSSAMIEKKHWAAKTQHTAEATHVFSGNAYWCPAT